MKTRHFRHTRGNLQLFTHAVQAFFIENAEIIASIYTLSKSNENEIHNIGCLDYFHSNHFCFVEWPERIEKFIPESFCKIYLKFHGYGRKIKIII